MATKAAAVDFSKILASGIGKETSAQIVAFRKRHDDAKRALLALRELPATVDIAHYKNLLKVSVKLGSSMSASVGGATYSFLPTVLCYQRHEIVTQ